MMTQHITVAPEGARAVDPLERYSRVQTGIRVDALRNCAVSELWHLRDAIHTINEVIYGLMWSPHFKDEAGGKVLSGLSEFACWYEDAVVAAAKASKPTTKEDVNWRSWTILGHEASCVEDLAAFAVLAVEAVRDEADAAFDERHARKAVQS